MRTVSQSDLQKFHATYIHFKSAELTSTYVRGEYFSGSQYSLTRSLPHSTEARSIFLTASLILTDKTIQLFRDWRRVMRGRGS